VWDGKLGLNHAVLTLYTFFVWPVVVVVVADLPEPLLLQVGAEVAAPEHKHQLFFHLGHYLMYCISVLGMVVQVVLEPVVLAVQELIVTYL
jgi:hypothetical protein